MNRVPNARREPGTLSLRVIIQNALVRLMIKFRNDGEKIPIFKDNKKKKNNKKTIIIYTVGLLIRQTNRIENV